MFFTQGIPEKVFRTLAEAEDGDDGEESDSVDVFTEPLQSTDNFKGIDRNSAKIHKNLWCENAKIKDKEKLQNLT